jgi:hypothetical protein
MISYRRLRKEKRERYLELESKKLKGMQIKELFGKPDNQVRTQLFNLVKDKDDYKQQLKKMKELFK